MNGTGENDMAGLNEMYKKSKKVQFTRDYTG